MIFFETNLFLLSHRQVLVLKIGGTALIGGFSVGLMKRKPSFLEENEGKLNYCLRLWEKIEENSRKLFAKVKKILEAYIILFHIHENKVSSLKVLCSDVHIPHSYKNYD